MGTKQKQQLFDEEVHRLHEQGLNYMEISKRLGASYDVVKSIGEGRYGRGEFGRAQLLLR